MYLSKAKQSYIFDCRARDLSQHTVRVYDQRLDHFLDFLEPKGIHEAEQLMADHLKEFIIELSQRDRHAFTNHLARGDPLSKRTIFHYTRVVKTWGVWLVEEGIAFSPPLTLAQRPLTQLAA